jgi:hypothetical protein
MSSFCLILSQPSSPLLNPFREEAANSLIGGDGNSYSSGQMHPCHWPTCKSIKNWLLSHSHPPELIIHNPLLPGSGENNSGDEIV